jgi:hypothetical protein
MNSLILWSERHEDLSLENHVRKLWNLYSNSVYASQFENLDLKLFHFFSLDFVKENFQLEPQIYFIQSFLHDTLRPSKIQYVDCHEILQFIVICGLSYKHIINHLHAVEILNKLWGKVEQCFLYFQKHSLRSPNIYTFVQSNKINQTIRTVCSWQKYVNGVDPLNSKKKLFFHRIFTDIQHVDIIPQLQWGEENDWFVNMDTFIYTGSSPQCIEEYQDVFAKFNPFLKKT